MALESLLLKAANGQCFEEQLQTVRESCYSGDFNFDDLKRHLLLLVDIIKQGTPSVKEVTSIRTICDAMNSQPVFKSMLHEVHNLLRLYLTVPISSATAERTFSALRRVLTYLWATMTEKRLNNCLVLHVHKCITDECDLVKIAKEFVMVNDERMKYFGTF